MVAAAVVAGVVAIGSGVAASEGADDASDRVAAGNKKARAVQERIYEQNKANLTPWMNRGNAAGDIINGFLGLGDADDAQAAFQTWLKSTDYDFTTKAGLDAIAGSQATKGMLNSGSTLKASMRFGQDNAQRYVGNWLGALDNQQKVGLQATSALAGVGTNYANALTGLYQSTAAADANAELIQAQATIDALQSIGSIFSYGVGSGGGALGGLSNFGVSSYGTAAKGVQDAFTGFKAANSGGMG